jgi:pyruvate kinase
MPLTKLVCTIGPASQQRIGELVEAGMDVARLNFSHGAPDQHRAVATTVRDAAAAAGRTVAILADLPGPKIRLGELPGGERELNAGEQISLAGDPGPSEVGVTYGGLADDVAAGDRLMLSDGAVELRVTDTGSGKVTADVIRGGTVRSGAGLNAPSERLRLPAITDRDRAALPAAQALGADYVAQSFVRRGTDIRELRELMGDAPVPIMAKIETRSAVENLDEILVEADALMLARGDLGVEIPFAEVPLIQKRVIDACVTAGIPVVVATQMLESMVSTARPTRAEASDVANAVLDGADAVMLSAETAIGRYPVLAARAAVAICRAAEEDPTRTHRPPANATFRGQPAAIAAAAVELARDSKDPRVAGIGCFTRTGQTAGLLARLRPGCPILALSSDPAVVRRLALLRAITPVRTAVPGDTDEMIELLEHSLLASGMRAGDLVVLVASIPFGAASTNFLKLHRLREDVAAR